MPSVLKQLKQLYPCMFSDKFIDFLSCKKFLVWKIECMLLLTWRSVYANLKYVLNILILLLPNATWILSKMHKIVVLIDDKYMNEVKRFIQCAFEVIAVSWPSV